MNDASRGNEEILAILTDAAEKMPLTLIEGGMILELHDSEVGNTFAGRVKNLDYDYQAEMWVKEIAEDHIDIVRWVLTDAQGERAVWERNEGETCPPRIIVRSPRYTGTWAI